MAEMKWTEKFFVNSKLYNLLYSYFVLKRLKNFVGKEFITGKTLEIGCGVGYTSAFLKDNFVVKELVSLDYDQQQIDLTKKRKREDITFVQGDATKLSYQGNSFDTVVQLMACHHIAGWKKVLQETFRVLKKDGVFVSMDIGNIAFNKLLHVSGYVEGLFTTDEYCHELEQMGFTIEKIQRKKVFMIIARKR
ncbi:class I SAM-dependent methyltransferase [Candidatus Woesearchaeota archaeon]|nr:class I SAM-dependent methyltransferase [Candidatus Woesearchaeota archaeon]